MNGNIYDNHTIIHDTLYTASCATLPHRNMQLRNTQHFMV